jgi:5-methylcytosine-specific restriction endonuclease McrA
MSKKLESLYKVSKNVYERRSTISEAVEFIAKKNEISEGSVRMTVIQIFPNMMNGNVFTYNQSCEVFDYFLEQILKDYGNKVYKIALSSMEKHLKYRAEQGKSDIKLRGIIKKHLLLSSSPVGRVENSIASIDEKEQDEIIKHLKSPDVSRANIIHELNNVQKTDAETTEINHRIYKRDNKTIAQIKFIRDFKCQICSTSIIKRDGSKYIEAAHIEPKHKGGRETVDNIILLCPNHHKEFDFGALSITSHTKTQLEFLLNHKKYKINLTIK